MEIQSIVKYQSAAENNEHEFSSTRWTDAKSKTDWKIQNDNNLLSATGRKCEWGVVLNEKISQKI
jgi:hypothetical protein